MLNSNPTIDQIQSALKVSRDMAMNVSVITNMALSIELKLEAINGLLGLYGVEYIRVSTDPLNLDNGKFGLEYVNNGESYATTVCYDHSQGKFLLISTGDWTEQSADYLNRVGEWSEESNADFDLRDFQH